MEVHKLLVDCVECDVRNITKAILESYEEIKIDAVKVISNAKANELMAAYPITIDATDIVCLPSEGEIVTVNGKKKIAGGEIDKPISLIVNGLVEIEKDAEHSLKNIMNMQINGKIVYPSNLEGKLPPMQLNGTAESYPGDAIRLKNEFEVDELFLLRVKPEKYYASRCMMILDAELDLKKMPKETMFMTKKAYIAKSLLADAVCHFDDETEIVVVADNAAWVSESLVLDEDAVLKYGDKILVGGDLIIKEESEGALEIIDFLQVAGKVIVKETLFRRMLEKKVIYKECIKYKESVVLEKEEVVVDSYFTEKYAEGVAFVDCGVVTFEENVTADFITDKMKIYDCGVVKCSKEQKPAVSEISVGSYISLNEEEDDEEEKVRDGKYKDWKVIDAVKYVF